MESTKSSKALVSSAWKIIPYFPSRSITETISFYTSKLHFTLGGTDTPDDKEPKFCSLFIGSKAEANIYFFLQSFESSPMLSPAAAMIALGTQELDSYYALLQGEDEVEIVEPIENKEWGYRQFTILDGDNNRLTFFKFLEGGNGPNEM